MYIRRIRWYPTYPEVRAKQAGEQQADLCKNHLRLQIAVSSRGLLCPTLAGLGLVRRRRPQDACARSGEAEEQAGATKYKCDGMQRAPSKQASRQASTAERFLEGDCRKRTGKGARGEWRCPCQWQSKRHNRGQSARGRIRGRRLKAAKVLER
jgi:hypothetical protein